MKIGGFLLAFLTMIALPIFFIVLLFYMLQVIIAMNNFQTLIKDFKEFRKQRRK